MKHGFAFAFVTVAVVTLGALQTTEAKPGVKTEYRNNGREVWVVCYNDDWVKTHENFVRLKITFPRNCNDVGCTKLTQYKNIRFRDGGAAKSPKREFIAHTHKQPVITVVEIRELD